MHNRPRGSGREKTKFPSGCIGTEQLLARGRVKRAEGLGDEAPAYHKQAPDSTPAPFLHELIEWKEAGGSCEKG